MNDYVALILGIVCAGIGGELFVRGAVGIAYWARISPGIIGATVVAFATSSPELSVSINAGVHKKHAGCGETNDSVIPAEAGIQKLKKWTPVFTGVTNVVFKK